MQCPYSKEVINLCPEFSPSKPNVCSQQTFGIQHPKQDVNHLGDHLLTNESQYDFERNHSRLSNLEFFYDLIYIYDESTAMDTIHIEFQKASGKIPHLLLLEKTKSHGTHGILRWLKKN